MNRDEVFHQTGYRYRFDWGEAGVRNLAPLSDVVVIIDVLSFTTCVNIAVSCGATVFPYRYKDESAQAFADSVQAQLAGPREPRKPGVPQMARLPGIREAIGAGQGQLAGLRGPGEPSGRQGQLAGPRGAGEPRVTPSLSPGSLQSVQPGARIVLPSPNGSACTVTASEVGVSEAGGCEVGGSENGADTTRARKLGTVVIAGCLRNASAVARYIQERHAKDAVTVIACGEHWPNGLLRPSMEDILAAGAILSHFEGELPPEARVAVGAFRAMEGDLLSALRDCASGRELIAKGFPEDVNLASELNVSHVVPVLRGGAYGKGYEEKEPKGAIE